MRTAASWGKLRVSHASPSPEARKTGVALKSQWTIAALATVIGLSLGFAACGGDDNSSATSTASASASTTNTPESTASQKATATAKKTATPKATATRKSTATPADTGATIDASTPQIKECTLVSLADLTAAVGDQFTTAGTPDGDTCVFESDNSTEVDITTYDLSAYGSNVKDTFESIPVVFGDDILSSPGDEAYYDPEAGLAVLSGNIELDVDVIDPFSLTTRAATFAIADLILPKLP